MAVRVPALPQLGDGQRGDRLVAGEQPGGMCGDDPRAAVGCGVLAEPGGGHDAVSSLQSHRAGGDVNGHSGPALAWDGRKASDNPSGNDPRRRQTEPDVPGHSMPFDVR